jgi:hypothetical protein
MILKQMRKVLFDFYFDQFLFSPERVEIFVIIIDLDFSNSFLKGE